MTACYRMRLTLPICCGDVSTVYAVTSRRCHGDVCSTQRRAGWSRTIGIASNIKVTCQLKGLGTIGNVPSPFHETFLERCMKRPQIQRQRQIQIQSRKKKERYRFLRKNLLSKKTILLLNLKPSFGPPIQTKKARSRPRQLSPNLAKPLPSGKSWRD